MKRYRRMIPLGAVTEQLVKDNQNPEFRKALLKTLPKKIFGEAIAANIKSVEIGDGCLTMRVPSDSWRHELSGRKAMILEKAREIHQPIDRIELIP